MITFKDFITESSSKVSQIILQQLGGNKFIAMTGAKNFVGSDDYLMFSIGRGAKNSINKVKITLDSNDTYTVEFAKMRGINYTVVKTVSGIYFDQLQAVFKRNTGMDTRL